MRNDGPHAADWKDVPYATGMIDVHQVMDSSRGPPMFWEKYTHSEYKLRSTITDLQNENQRCQYTIKQLLHDLDLLQSRQATLLSDYEKLRIEHEQLVRQQIEHEEQLKTAMEEKEREIAESDR
jgi:hypothetical protein